MEWSPYDFGYTITSTTLGADQRVKSLIPDIKIQVGNQDIPIVHTHTVEFRVQGGPYAERAEMAVVFPQNVRLLSKPLIETASPVHHMSCEDQVQNSIVCHIDPLKADDGFFRISFAATGANTSPTLSMAAKGVELAKVEEILADRDIFFKYQLFLVCLTVAAYGLLLFRFQLLRRRVPRFFELRSRKTIT